MSVTLAPTAYSAKAKTASLTIPSNDPESPKIVILKGSCPRPNITGVPKILNFGTKATGGSYSKSITIGNRLKLPLSLTSFEVSNDDEDSHDFSLSNDTTGEGASLAKGETCEVWVYFRPSSAGEKTGSLALSHNGATGALQTATVILRGTGEGPSVDSPPAINSFSALPVAVTLGSSTTLSWNVTNADALSINQGVGTVTGNYKHAIFSNDYIRIRGGTFLVSVSARDAIRSINGFIFDDGKLTINATGTTTDNESKGIKVEGSDDSAYNGAGKGYIVINGGTASADYAFNGLYLGSTSYSGGTAGTSFTVSKKVTDLSR